ncbi:hypothetical protein HK098_005795 [Nowakowskiella sp. JEL0407]|nr:hypothetical protein HK098_005795 [Nowakowskiella sp. JEL0407]
MFNLLVTGIRRMPADMYPVYGMIAIAIGFGAYVATDKIMHDQDLMIRVHKPPMERWEKKVAEWEAAHKK